MAKPLACTAAQLQSWTGVGKNGKSILEKSVERSLTQRLYAVSGYSMRIHSFE